jgi:hypothetical protein
MPSFYSRETAALQWTLPDVLPGVCRLFLRMPVGSSHMAPPMPATRLVQVSLDDSGLSVYAVQLALRTHLAIPLVLEAVFLDEPTLDHMEGLHEFARRLCQHGLPALIAGQF